MLAKEETKNRGRGMPPPVPPPRETRMTQNRASKDQLMKNEQERRESRGNLGAQIMGQGNTARAKPVNEFANAPQYGTTANRFGVGANKFANNRMNSIGERAASGQRGRTELGQAEKASAALAQYNNQLYSQN